MAKQIGHKQSCWYLATVGWSLTDNEGNTGIPETIMDFSITKL